MKIRGILGSKLDDPKKRQRRASSQPRAKPWEQKQSSPRAQAPTYPANTTTAPKPKAVPKTPCSDLSHCRKLRNSKRETGPLMQATSTRLCRWVSLAVCSMSFASAYGFDGPTWAKQATPLDLSCSSHVRATQSPDRRWTVQVVCLTPKNYDPAYDLRITDRAGRSFQVTLQDRTQEILWAPDSKAFLLNGGQSGYWGFFVTVYELTPKGFQKHVVTDAAQRDMVASFPPCRAANRDEVTCARLVKSPEYNMSGLGWSKDSRSVFVFAEVPCSSSYGGIMCQVIGYQISVSDGHIVKRITASQANAEWHGLMAWQMHVPDPPIYGSPYVPH